MAIGGSGKALAIKVTGSSIRNHYLLESIVETIHAWQFEKMESTEVTEIELTFRFNPE